MDKEQPLSLNDFEDIDKEINKILNSHYIFFM